MLNMLVFIFSILMNLVLSSLLFLLNLVGYNKDMQTLIICPILQPGNSSLCQNRVFFIDLHAFTRPLVCYKTQKEIFSSKVMRYFSLILSTAGATCDFRVAGLTTLGFVRHKFLIRLCPILNA